MQKTRCSRSGFSFSVMGSGFPGVQIFFLFCGRGFLVEKTGHIVEEGSHEELMALNGDYAQLYNTQNLNG